MPFNNINQLTSWNPLLWYPVSFVQHLRHCFIINSFLNLNFVVSDQVCTITHLLAITSISEFCRWALLKCPTTIHHLCNNFNQLPHELLYILTMSLSWALKSELEFLFTMASSMVLKLACLVALCTVAIARLATADISCGQVVNYLMPCVSYVQNGGTVPANCCGGIKTLYQAAQTTADRQSVCNCLKNALNQVPFPYTNYNLGLAAGLPAKCGIDLPYKISPSTDCKRYISSSDSSVF